MNSDVKPALIGYNHPLTQVRPKSLGIGLRLPERKLLLSVMDLAILNSALLITLAIRQQFPIGGPMWGYNLMWSISLSCLWLVVGAIFDVYNLSKAAKAMPSLWAVVCTALITTIGYQFIPYVTPSLPANRFEAFILVALAVLGLPVWRVLYAFLIIQPVFEQRTMIVGAGSAGTALMRAIAEASGVGSHVGSGYRVLGFIDDDPAKQNTSVEGVPVLGTHRDLCQLVRQLQPNELVIAITRMDDVNPTLFQAILNCREMGIPVTMMAAFYEQLTGKVAVDQAGHDLEVVLPTNESDTERIYQVLRRLVDIAVGLVGCVALALLVPLVWLANRIFSPGPIFYSQERVGCGGRTFRITKFRSMVVDAEQQTGAVWASKSDARITPVGRILRLSRIDEIPQVINVLKGEMSLVGPRPERPEFVKRLAVEIPYYRARHAVKPGLTGWAQVKYRYGASVNDARIKLQYDLYYIKHRSIYLDLLIVLKTVQVVLLFKGQ